MELIRELLLLQLVYRSVWEPVLFESKNVTHFNLLIEQKVPSLVTNTNTNTNTNIETDMDADC